MKEQIKRQAGLGFTYLFTILLAGYLAHCVIRNAIMEVVMCDIAAL